MEEEDTTIKVKKKIAKRLEKLKVHPRQPYEEVILELLDNNHHHCRGNPSS